MTPKASIKFYLTRFLKSELSEGVKRESELYLNNAKSKRKLIRTYKVKKGKSET